ncbi:MAG: CDGSH iron-sulfur domain-containing protein [Proteobacteria bacterium]|nr:CDGSH iron-sulfur domain-containing protein [Pseudomonadota bacterium]MCZ6784878.1 CDGSH iron-sulfur domain-containing protein [Pseudomonadota bacterium]
MKVKIFENGPIALDTEDEVSVNLDGSTEKKAGPLFLCRCGQSSTKPFCDGTHRKVEFRAPGAELDVG